MSLETLIQTRFSRGNMIWLSIAIVSVLLVVSFADGLKFMVETWFTKDEYSHGVMIPFVALYFFYQKKNDLMSLNARGSWYGLVVVMIGGLLFIIGELSTLYIIVQYAFLVTLVGVILSFLGIAGFKKVWVPILLLWFMIPLPNFIYFNLSSQLQLLSSQIGVAVIRLFGISVYLEGNVIDLGSYKLQVVEACSGLRYLFPLMSFAFICASIYKGRLWMRMLVFLSSAPITVFMNSFRIGVIGVLVEYYGIGAAEGFLHDFEGWIIFIACTAILISEIWLLNRFFGGGASFRDVFSLHLPVQTAQKLKKEYRLPNPYLASIGMLLVVAISTNFITKRFEQHPDRMDLVSFPLEVEKWQGSRSSLKQMELEALKLTDYVVINYSDGVRDPINYYVAYYASQRKGSSIHSPRSCIPGGGWRITEFSQQSFPDITIGKTTLTVNRLVIQMGSTKQLVYYWFLQRGRVLTNEYLVKWYLFWDALTRNRTDGALVRLTTTINLEADTTEADRALAEFAKAISTELSRYVPD